jgi:hypothetical protein
MADERTDEQNQKLQDAFVTFGGYMPQGEELQNLIQSIGLPSKTISTVFANRRKREKKKAKRNSVSSPAPETIDSKQSSTDNGSEDLDQVIKVTTALLARKSDSELFFRRGHAFLKQVRNLTRVMFLLTPLLLQAVVVDIKPWRQIVDDKKFEAALADFRSARDLLYKL